MLRFLALALLLSAAGPASALNAKQRSKVDAWAAQASELAMDGEDLRKAHRTAMRALRRDEEHPIALFALAMVMIHTIERGLATEAEVEELKPIITEVFESVIAAHPESPEAVMARSQMAQESGRSEPTEGAEADCRGVDEVIAAAAIALAEGDYEGAMTDCERALAQCPGDPALLTYTGEALLSQDRLSEALARFEQALDVSPCFRAAHQSLAKARIRAGDLGGAREALSRSVGCHPDDESGWRELQELAARDGMTLVYPATRTLGVVMGETGPRVEVKGDGTPVGDLLAEFAVAYAQALLERARVSSAETHLERTVSALAPLLVLFAERTLDLTPDLDRSHPRFILWSLLERARDEGRLSAAVLVLLSAPDFGEDIWAWHEDERRRLELAAYVRSLLRPRP